MLIDNDLDNEKMFYSIGEVAKIFDINTSLIRFWEKEFEIIAPKKNTTGKRQFTKQDIYNFKIIYHLVKEKGFTLQGAKEKLKRDKKKNYNTISLKNKLKGIRAKLVKLKENN
jgi:DNA-binding transcriptional MerR regulator